MNNEQIFEWWAPPSGRWSPWVKPVLFACMREPTVPSQQQPIELEPGTVLPSEETALVLDLPGAEGIWMSIGLLPQGYWPVPLYNAVPGPTLSGLLGDAHLSPLSVVDVETIIAALAQATSYLMDSASNPNASPAFLLDANRRGEGVTPIPGQFDNRSISFTTDFPSALFLTAKGIRRVILIQRTGEAPQPDLAHSLRRWQDGGICIELKRLDVPGPALPIEVRKPSAFGLLWQRALAMVGLRRHGLGGFGGFVPQPSAG